MSRPPGHARVRITPTYAGSTPPPGTSTASASDHPHLRGEHLREVSLCAVPAGSPPPTRGAQGSGGFDEGGARITPTYAGSTLPTKTWPFPLTDHPHLRGEHVGLHLSGTAGHGSPPPTRGALDEIRPTFARVRITPTYAGSTSASPAVETIQRDHPHLRGEHHDRHRPRLLQCGSPPPTRGALSDRCGDDADHRITPTYAGSTITVDQQANIAEDHPHLRGEHAADNPLIPLEDGSPPPTRGARGGRRRRSGRGRITPTYAGSTFVGRG